MNAPRLRVRHYRVVGDAHTVRLTWPHDEPYLGPEIRLLSQSDPGPLLVVGDEVVEFVIASDDLARRLATCGYANVPHEMYKAAADAMLSVDDGLFQTP